MEHELVTMKADLNNVDTHTEGLLNMMTELTSKVRANRDGILAGVTGLEEKMKKAGFSLAEIEVRLLMVLRAVQIIIQAGLRLFCFPVLGSVSTASLLHYTSYTPESLCFRALV